MLRYHICGKTNHHTKMFFVIDIIHDKSWWHWLKHQPYAIFWWRPVYWCPLVARHQCACYIHPVVRAIVLAAVFEYGYLSSHRSCGQKSHLYSCAGPYTIWSFQNNAQSCHKKAIMFINKLNNQSHLSHVPDFSLTRNTFLTQQCIVRLRGRQSL